MVLNQALNNIDILLVILHSSMITSLIRLTCVVTDYRTNFAVDFRTGVFAFLNKSRRSFQLKNFHFNHF